MARSTSFYYAFLALPRDRRNALVAVWDFCRAVDDAVDLEGDPDRATSAIQEWRREVGRIFSGGAPATTEGKNLGPFVRTFDLPRDQFEALIDGVAMDITPRSYATFEDLEPYCHRVASAVGVICRSIFGGRDPSGLDYARDLGVALQLTNILRDVAVDFQRGRVYLPEADLARFACSQKDIATAVGGRSLEAAPKLRAVLEHHAARARVFFSRATRALPPQELRLFLPAEIMRGVYWDLLRRIESNDHDVFGATIRVPKPAQARIALREWWRSKAAAGAR
jgi:phytoene synthase